MDINKGNEKNKQELFDFYKNNIQKNYSFTKLSKRLSLNINTVNRWVQKKQIPMNYVNDINYLYKKQCNGNKANFIPLLTKERKNDEFYTNQSIAKYCYELLTKKLKLINFNTKNYIYIEPSVGNFNFYGLLPKNKRIGIDIKQSHDSNIIKMNFLDFIPKKKKYIVVGNPPFGLRGNLALRFINHAAKFSDIIAFILPPLFNSDGKGTPKSRIDKNFNLLFEIKIPENSFHYPNGKIINVQTIFQILIKKTLYIRNIIKFKKCDSKIKLFSLSNGETSSSKRNVKMLDKCDLYLPSTSFKILTFSKKFIDLPNKRGYGVKILDLENKEIILKKIKMINWQKYSFKSTNSANNLRFSLIKNAIIAKGIHDN